MSQNVCDWDCLAHSCALLRFCQRRGAWRSLSPLQVKTLLHGAGARPLTDGSTELECEIIFA